jgi:2-dehydro-3-deoxy-D-arabinonate dehydratase
MKLCRFRKAGCDTTRIGLYANETVLLDLTAAGVLDLHSLLDSDDPVAALKQIDTKELPQFALQEIRFCAPVERQEVWAAGVAYLRSKSARMDESDFSASAYDRVYTAPRPEIFFKSLAEKVVTTGETVGIRKDARWSVPEPELALVINSKGKVVGYTIGNDMSSRDIEGENLLYLPQAKVYKYSCALGPCIALGATEAEARTWTISVHIFRDGKDVFSGKTSVDQIKRSFSELIDYLWRSQEFPHGVVLLTGTGIVPGDDFTLQPGDSVRINISGIGSIENTVVEV